MWAIYQAIWTIDFAGTFITDLSDWLHNVNMKEAKRSFNKDNFPRQLIKHIGCCTSLDYMQKIQSYLALEDCNNIDCENVFNLLSATDTRLVGCRPHPICLMAFWKKCIFLPIPQQVHHLSETHVYRVYTTIKLTLLSVSNGSVFGPFLL
jgi:hypothetical protein